MTTTRPLTEEELAAWRTKVKKGWGLQRPSSLGHSAEWQSSINEYNINARINWIQSWNGTKKTSSHLDNQISIYYKGLTDQIDNIIELKQAIIEAAKKGESTLVKSKSKELSTTIQRLEHYNDKINFVRSNTEFKELHKTINQCYQKQPPSDPLKLWEDYKAFYQAADEKAAKLLKEKLGVLDEGLHPGPDDIYIYLDANKQDVAKSCETLNNAIQALDKVYKDPRQFPLLGKHLSALKSHVLDDKLSAKFIMAMGALVMAAGIAASPWTLGITAALLPVGYKIIHSGRKMLQEANELEKKVDQEPLHKAGASFMEEAKIEVSKRSGPSK